VALGNGHGSQQARALIQEASNSVQIPVNIQQDLLDVSGLGPKSFENCAAFCRVTGPEPLDATLVHPESYDLAGWLLKKMSWKLSETPQDIPLRRELCQNVWLLPLP